MKKLMIVACAIALAAVANASTYAWNVSKVAAYGDGESSDGYAAYLIENYTGTITGENLASVIADYGKVDDWGGLENGGTDGESKEWDPGSTVNARVLVLDAADVAGAKHFYLTEAQQNISDPVMGAWNPGALSFDASSSSSTEAWTATSAVPEPTSGLLLLLGVAGLALRRRRA